MYTWGLVYIEMCTSLYSMKLAQQQYISKLWHLLSLNTNRMCGSDAHRGCPYQLAEAIVPEFHSYCYHESSG